MSNPEQPKLPPINPVRTEVLTAPLVHLVQTDPKDLSPEALQKYLANIREMRGNAATVRAKTERAKKDGTMKKSLSDLL